MLCIYRKKMRNLNKNLIDGFDLFFVVLILVNKKSEREREKNFATPGKFVCESPLV